MLKLRMMDTFYIRNVNKTEVPKILKLLFAHKNNVPQLFQLLGCAQRNAFGSFHTQN